LRVCGSSPATYASGKRLERPGGGESSPSAELMVDPDCGVRCAIRDTGAPGDGRYHWTVTVVGESDPLAAGRTGGREEARWQAEAALAARIARSSEPLPGSFTLE
jgi:hypothetical protein